MTEEPRWPTVDDVAKAAEPSWLPSRTDVALTIKLCRDAWLASVDDPAADPVGTVRRGTGGNGEAVAVKSTMAHDHVRYVWFAFTGRGNWQVDDEDVKGWPILGAVPGTPAAEAKP
jgi:mannose-6-phosphate isomerase-like protein (cupin superfamily)